jgi:hypothetical protein
MGLLKIETNRQHIDGFINSFQQVEMHSQSRAYGFITIQAMFVITSNERPNMRFPAVCLPNRYTLTQASRSL